MSDAPTKDRSRSYQPGGPTPDSGIYEALRDGQPVTTARGPLRCTAVRGKRLPPIKGGGVWRKMIDTQPND